MPYNKIRAKQTYLVSIVWLPILESELEMHTITWTQFPTADNIKMLETNTS